MYLTGGTGQCTREAVVARKGCFSAVYRLGHPGRLIIDPLHAADPAYPNSC